MTPGALAEFLEKISAADDGSIILPKICFNRYFNEYKESVNRTTLVKKFVGDEIKTRNNYVGREVLEMIQNADDQESSYIAVYVNTKKCEISFVNGGKPFRYAGFEAVMVGGTSPKANDLSSIGNKGLGFRSILNWGDSIEIFSRKTHCSFSLETAKKKWNELKKSLTKLAVDDVLRFARNQSISEECPISVFTVPDYEPFDNFPEEYRGLDDIATIIKIRYNINNQQSIIDQITSLPANTLIFLRKRAALF
jgi:hypothetical protein